MPTGIFTKAQRIDQIRGAVASGDYSFLEDLAGSLELQPRTIMGYVLRTDIRLPPFRNRDNSYGNIRQDPALDELIVDGRYQTLKQVAKKYSLRKGNAISKERVRQYIVARGLQGVFDESRDGYRREQGRVVGGLVSGQGFPDLLNDLIVNKRAEASEQEAFAYDLTIGRETGNRSKNSPNLLPFSRVYPLLMDYWQIREDGKNKSITEFGRDNGIHFVTVGNIFRELGLPPLGKKKIKKKRVITPDWKKDLIDRSYDGIMSAVDIAHFLNMPAWNVKDRFKRISKRENRERKNVKKATGPYGKEVLVRYSAASQIYEARNAGFSDTETLGLVNVREKEREWYWRSEEWIRDDIINTLKFFYAGQEVSKPWVTPNLRAFDGAV